LSYHAVDLAQLIERRPDQARRVLLDIAALASQGQITPLPYALYPADAAGQALDELKRSAHTGKLIIDTTSIPAPARQVTFDPDGSYLVTGGTAGFGAETARWLARNGAGHVIATGRRAPDHPPALPNITTMAADVTDRAAMAEVIADAQALAPHGLRGVFHCAATYDDAPVTDLAPARYAAVLAPKATGAVLLSELTSDCDLDYFVLYSSISALLGNRLQASYAAANMCLESLALQRRESGKPALAIGWGAIAGTGIVARDNLTESITGLGLEPMPPAEALSRLGEILLREQAPHSAIIARADWDRVRVMLPSAAAARFSGLVTPDADRPGQAASLRGQLHAADPAHALQTAVNAITSLVANIMRTSPDRISLATPLNLIGLDSILATELAVTMRRELAIDIPALEILGSGGITHLASRALAAAGIRHQQGQHP
jgi:NAD(P)-dependent dehydrogenase (short-subunit alcohol dehydrogenase family)/acyl carrier protein